MGRLIETQTLGFICNVTGCKQKLICPPIEGKANWRDHVEELAEGVEEGWVAVLSYRMRTYCPDHANFAYSCSCKGLESKKNFCPIHGEAGLEHTWDQKHIPLKAQRLLPTTSSNPT